jgi:methionine-rich copper-binding protein CopC
MRSLAVLALTFALLACKREEPAPPPDAKSTTRYSEVTTTAPPRDLRNAQIAVTTPLMPSAMASCKPAKSEYAVNEPIQLVLKLNESPSELVVGARILDEAEELAYVTVPAEGKKDVTVTVKEKLKPGTYKLEGYWGGNLVCEHEIEVQ